MPSSCPTSNYSIFRVSSKRHRRLGDMTRSGLSKNGPGRCIAQERRSSGEKGGETSAIWLSLRTQTCALYFSNVPCSFYRFVRFSSKVTYSKVPYIVHSFMSRFRHLTQGCLHVYFEHWGSNPEPFVPNFVPTSHGFEHYPHLTSAPLH